MQTVRSACRGGHHGSLNFPCGVQGIQTHKTVIAKASRRQRRCVPAGGTWCRTNRHKGTRVLFRAASIAVCLVVRRVRTRTPGHSACFASGWRFCCQPARSLPLTEGEGDLASVSTFRTKWFVAGLRVPRSQGHPAEPRLPRGACGLACVGRILGS